MDSRSLKQRTRREPTSSTASKDNTNRSRREKRMAMAKRGFRSLAVAVSIPVSLSLLAIYLASTNTYYAATSSSKPFWFPPLWALHFTSIASTFLMGLSSWLVWAEGGFHKNPMAVYLYSAQLALSLAWDPIVFGAGSPRSGFIVCLGMLGTLLGCCKAFKEVNPIAGDVMKPCLAWTAFLAILNFKLLFI